MDKLTVQERKKYEKMWSSSGYEYCEEPTPWLPLFFTYFGKKLKSLHSVSDFGCGRAASSFSFLYHGLSVQLVDITDHALLEAVAHAAVLRDDLTFIKQSLWELNAEVVPTNWLFCTDVLEHIPTEKIDLVLEKMASRMLNGGLFVICLIDDSCGALINQRLHLTVKPGSWWLEKFSQYFHIQTFRYVDDTHIIVVC
jgi:2-polyprenyl-3-methyl-5-hydroxy-6-metoxy-1,4-benzoquinol methylase